MPAKQPTPQQKDTRYTQVTTFDEGDTVQRVLSQNAGQHLARWMPLQGANWTACRSIDMATLLDKLKHSGDPT
ncbi:MAG UNVERIFIED_CONTAM: hypothetical protein LVT10_21770 [Anaerolineae bacterium]